MGTATPPLLACFATRCDYRHYCLWQKRLHGQQRQMWGLVHPPVHPTSGTHVCHQSRNSLNLCSLIKMISFGVTRSTIQLSSRQRDIKVSVVGTVHCTILRNLIHADTPKQQGSMNVSIEQNWFLWFMISLTLKICRFRVLSFDYNFLDQFVLCWIWIDKWISLPSWLRAKLKLSPECSIAKGVSAVRYPFGKLNTKHNNTTISIS